MTEGTTVEAGNLAGYFGHDPAAIRAAAIDYAARGWPVVVLHGQSNGQCDCGQADCKVGCKREKSVAKHPRLNEWGKHATIDVAIIGGWLQHWPASNLGVKLGPESGIVDLETDSPEGEELLRGMFGGKIPRTPSFSSGGGTHRLFLYRDDLPKQAHCSLGAGLGDVKIGSGTKVVDGKLEPLSTQSVFPPSWHYSGRAYAWLVRPDECDVAALPDEVVARINTLVTDKKPSNPVLFNDSPLDTSPSVESVLRLLRKSRNAAKFSALFDSGDTGNDASRADMSLVTRLAWATGPDPALIDQLFRDSKLMRDKWDERRGDSTYGRKTIERVLSKKSSSDYYDWEAARRRAEARKNGNKQNAPQTEPTAESEAEPEQPATWGGLPQVWIADGGTTITQFSGVIGQLMGATGRYYSRGGSPMRKALDESGQVKLDILKPVAAMSEFETVARLMRTKTTPRGDVVDVPTLCGEPLARAVVASQAFNGALPPIRVLSRCPVLIERNGRLEAITGYDRESGILAMGEKPPVLTLEQAKAQFDKILCDFQFADAGDKSRAAAALITPALVFGGLLGGRAPASVGEADDSQSGKGFYHKLTAAIYGDIPHVVAQRERAVGSLQEVFDKAVISGYPFVSLDNLRGVLDLAWLESFLTESTYAARVPYAAAIEIDPSRINIMATSNKAEMNRDLGNRSSIFRIRKQGDKYKFRDYPEGNLLAHVQANQTQFLAAVFTVVSEWHRRGKPTIVDTQHDFRRWNRVLGWIVEHVLGFAPLMQGHREVQARVTSPLLNWLRDLAFAVKEAGRLNTWLRAHHLVDLVLERGIDTRGIDPELDTDNSESYMKATRAMGRLLSGVMKDKPSVEIDGMKVEREGRTDGDGREKQEMRFSAVPPITPNQSPNQNTGVPNPPNHFQHSHMALSPPEEQRYRSCEPIGGIGGNGISLGEIHRCSIRPQDWEPRGGSLHCPICGDWKGRAPQPA